MLLSWLKRRRRAKLLATPFPEVWFGYLERNVPLYARLNEHEKAVVRNDLRILVAEKHWEGCGGLQMTDEVKVTIAAHAALLLLGIDHDWFARVMSILVYPSGFRSPDGWRRSDGVVDLSVGALGQAWYDGPIVLAWDAVLAGALNAHDGHNVVLHEFAHQLDYLDGVIDGTPPLRSAGDYKTWHSVMTREYEQLKKAAESGRPTLLDTYGAESHAEFFAVATEAFFEKALEMCARHPELYSVLSSYYGQDPAARERREGDPAAPHPVVGPPRKQGRRWSREAARTPAHAGVVLDWPAWVRFWEIHPGVARDQALRPLDHHIVLTCIGLVCTLLAFGFLATQPQPQYLKLIFPVLITLTFAVLGLWLLLAVHWVDRHAIWGGDYRPPQQPQEGGPPEQAAAPEG
jgi:Mlc titration factor MtfA (ptsG expression regulator)